MNCAIKTSLCLAGGEGGIDERSLGEGNAESSSDFRLSQRCCRVSECHL